MSVKMTVIVDNTSSEGLKGEWGLSILAEHSGKQILVDAGGSELFAENLKKLDLDIGRIDYGVLSHAHCDHGNGIPKFLDENKKAKFYLRDTAAEDCYGQILFFKMYAGLPKGLDKNYHDRIEYVSGDCRLCDGVYLIPHKTDGLSAIGKREGMYRRTPSGWMPDDFSHEQSVVIDTAKGLVIINSCSHGGALNIINEVKETFPHKKIYGYIGGLHLWNKSRKEIEGIALGMERAGIAYVCTGHCTKNRAYRIMKEILGDKLSQLRTGLVIEI